MALLKITVVEFMDHVIRLTHELPDEDGYVYHVECEVWKVTDWGDESESSEDCWRVGGYDGKSEPSTDLNAHPCIWSVRIKWDGCNNWTYNREHYCEGLEGLEKNQAAQRECFRRAIEIMGKTYDR